jgi:hypothetical protein
MADMEQRDGGLPAQSSQASGWPARASSASGKAPLAAGYVPAGDDTLRASHEDRDKVAEILRVAAGDGRLSAEELDERLELALTAKTYADLAVLTTDLPAAGGHGLGTGLDPAASAEAKELAKIHVGSGNVSRENRWVVPKELDIKTRSGNVRLDFTQAVITQPLLRITAEVRSGNLTIITKPGIVVDADDVTIRSGNVKVREPWGHDAPALLRIEIQGTVRSGNVTARPPRRSFWEWLRRAPRPYAAAIEAATRR